MPRRKKDIDGGKLSLKKIGKTISKGFKKNIENPVAKAFVNPAMKGFTSMGSELGDFTNKQLLPGVVSVGIPLASTAIGALGAEVGLPPQITSKLSENLMKQYIPKEYQSKNKYVNLLGSALDMAVGGTDPTSAMNFANDLTGAVSSDLGGKKKSSNTYNPDNPYQDLITQLLQQQPQDSQTVQSNQPSGNTDASTMEQKTGNIDALMGSGLRKKRGRKKKSEEHIKVEIIKKLPYQKFSHAKNSALEQLLEATHEGKEKKALENSRDLTERQIRHLKALGYGL